MTHWKNAEFKFFQKFLIRLILLAECIEKFGLIECGDNALWLFYYVIELLIMMNKWAM